MEVTAASLLSSENVWLALIIAVPAMISPLLMAWLTNSQIRKGKIEDYARQDLVAERLVLADKRAVAIARVTNTKLEVIHKLVNSNMTAALQAQLDAYRASLALMLEMVELKRAAGKKPTAEVLTEIGSLQGKIVTLSKTLADRLKQQEEADKLELARSNAAAMLNVATLPAKEDALPLMDGAAPVDVVVVKEADVTIEVVDKPPGSDTVKPGGE